jgi:hypothetical protein
MDNAEGYTPGNYPNGMPLGPDMSDYLFGDPPYQS